MNFLTDSVGHNEKNDNDSYTVTSQTLCSSWDMRSSHRVPSPRRMNGSPRRTFAFAKLSSAGGADPTTS